MIRRCTSQNYVVGRITFRSVDADGVVATVQYIGASIDSPCVRILGRTFLNFNLNSCLVRRSTLFFFLSSLRRRPSSPSGNCSVSLPFLPAVANRAFKSRESTHVIITEILGKPRRDGALLCFSCFNQNLEQFIYMQQVSARRHPHNAIWRVKIWFFLL